MREQVFRNHIKSSVDKLKLFNFDRRCMKWDFGGDDEDTSTQTTTQTPQWYQAPDYAESTGARQNMWQTLQDWGKSGTYGLQLPNFEDVFQNAQKRLNQYYWGGASSPGLIDKIRSQAARRGVSDSPAIDVLTQRAGVEQAGQLGDISTQLDVTKADAIEKARMNWLTSIQNLASMKPSGTWGGTTTTTMTQPQESFWPSLVGAGIGLAGDYMFGNQLGKMMNKTNMPTTTGSIKGGAGGGAYDAADFAKFGASAASMIPGPQQPFVMAGSALANMFL